MKNLVLAIVAIITLASCQQQKIGYIDNGKVINDIQEKKDIESKYKTLQESIAQREDSIGKTFQMEYQSLMVKGAKLSQKKQQELIQPLQAKAQQFQQQIQTEKQQLQTGFQTEMDSVISKMKTTVKEYGKTNGYTFILGTNESVGTVLYGEEASDLSDVILKELDAEYKK